MLSRIAVVLGVALVVAMDGGSQSGGTAVAQQPEPPSDPSLPPGEVPEVSESPAPPPSVAGPIGTGQPPGTGQPDAGPGQPAPTVEQMLEAIPPEARPFAEKALETFRARRAEFEQSLLDQRSTHVRFVNGEDQSVQAREDYQKHRNRSRELMNETYEAAKDVFDYMPYEPAAQYILTIVEHRLQRDIYNRSTGEGGARLIEAGLRFMYVVQSAARSAVVAGEFELARSLFNAIEEEKRTDTDQLLLAQLEQLEANYKIEQEIRKKEEEEDRLPRVKLVTTRGEVMLELFIDQAPSTVANFIRLVESGFYDEQDFYQVIDNLLALTGDPSGSGNVETTELLMDEHLRPDARHAFRGSLVMAKVPAQGAQQGQGPRFVPNSASRQFAIMYLPMAQVSEEQTIFGRVIEGMDVISYLRRVDPSKEKKKNEMQLPPDRIITARVVRRPETLPEIKFFDPRAGF